MSRFYVAPQSVENDRIVLKGEQLHHVRDVMRLGVNDAVSAFDGAGNEYRGKIIESAPKQLVIKIEKKTAADNPEAAFITLACAIPKLDRMDYIVQKATELGVKKIVPLLTQRTVVILKDDKKISARRQRWQKIAIESSKQCGGAVLPEIGTVINFEDFLGEIKGFDLALVAALVEGAKNLKDVLRNSRARNILVMIGPEGDFTSQEVGAALKQGCIAVSLGKLVLRCDTAAIYALAVLNYEAL